MADKRSGIKVSERSPEQIAAARRRAAEARRRITEKYASMTLEISPELRAKMHRFNQARVKTVS